MRASTAPLYAEQAQVLEGRGVDLFMIETFFDLDELVSAVEAVRAVSSLPIVALLTFDDEAEVAGGIEASAAAATAGRARRRCDRDESRRRPACRADGARCDAWRRPPARGAPEHRPREHRRRTRRLSALDTRVLRRLRLAGRRSRRPHRRWVLRHDTGADRGDPGRPRREPRLARGLRGSRACTSAAGTDGGVRGDAARARTPCRATGSSASSSTLRRAGRTRR